MQHGRRGDTGEERHSDTSEGARMEADATWAVRRHRRGDTCGAGDTSEARRGAQRRGEGWGRAGGGKGERVDFSGRRKELCKGGAKPIAHENDAVQWSSMPNLQSLHHYNVIFAIGVIGVPFLRSPPKAVPCLQISRWRRDCGQRQEMGFIHIMDARRGDRKEGLIASLFQSDSPRDGGGE
ncbi:hypothetical protein GUJ93_ZPchr0016g2501 [Zizania palustris]|uniref:Uncharacterized protein n=1 Tax=Zizania palustris TaxID=103762 RepID=A0A8J5TI84_ZIZPA|nr:hypothetical protein GUJ93_ZPchr0016g2501 [Zizania palustris]